MKNGNLSDNIIINDPTQNILYKNYLNHINDLNNFHQMENNFSFFHGRSGIITQFPNSVQIKAIISSFGGRKYTKIKKRNYEKFNKGFRHLAGDLYKKEKDLQYKILNLNERKIKMPLVTNNEGNNNNLKSNNEKLNKMKKELEDLNKELDISRNKFIDKTKNIKEEIDFNFEARLEKKNKVKTRIESKEKGKNKCHNLSSSYLFGENSDLLEELDDTKETSFNLLNFSYDYPEFSLDNSITGKLISNAIELEKTFNKFFDVKILPNKK